MKQHFHESNLIEGYDDPLFDRALARAWTYLIKQDSLSHEVICNAQKIAVSKQTDLKKQWRGEYRKIDVWIAGRKGVSPLFIFPEMNDWIDRANSIKEHSPKDLHVAFEKIHPFVDGNGRTGRLLMWWHEVKLGLEPTLILNSEKQKYYEWFN